MLSEFYAVIFLLVFFWFIFPLSLVRLDVGLEVSDYSLQLCLLEGGLFGRRTFWVITEENKTIKFCNSHRKHCLKETQGTYYYFYLQP